VQGSRKSPNSEHLRPPPSLESDSRKRPDNNRLRDELRITRNVRGFIRPGLRREDGGVRCHRRRATIGVIEQIRCHRRPRLRLVMTEEAMIDTTPCDEHREFADRSRRPGARRPGVGVESSRCRSERRRGAALAV